jgi:hypothetical protein
VAEAAIACTGLFAKRPSANGGVTPTLCLPPAHDGEGPVLPSCASCMETGGRWRCRSRMATWQLRQVYARRLQGGLALHAAEFAARPAEADRRWRTCGLGRNHLRPDNRVFLIAEGRRATPSAGWMVGGTLGHQVNQVRARLKRTHHARGGLMEHLVGNMVEQMAFELKVYDKVHMGPCP